MENRGWKGCYLFPFPYSTPLLKISKKMFFRSFHPFLCWIKEKSVATLSYRKICEYKCKTSIKVGYVTVLHYVCWILLQIPVRGNLLFRCRKMASNTSNSDRKSEHLAFEKKSSWGVHALHVFWSMLKIDQLLMVDPFVWLVRVMDYYSVSRPYLMVKSICLRLMLDLMLEHRLKVCFIPSAKEVVAV